MKRILLCSSNPLLVKGLYASLRDEGYVVEDVEHPSLAVQKVLQGPYDLTIIDAEPFGMPAGEAARIVGAIAPGMPIVCLGGEGRPDLAHQQLPFQYSLHRIDVKGREPKHYEYLAEPGLDPRKEISEKLLGEIPEGACVLVYNMAFEKRVLRELGESIPRLRKRLNEVSEGMIDLMEPFKRRDIYHWRMNGSYSLKSVLPVLVPEMSYEELEIRDGAMASEAYFTMEDITDPAELSRLRAALLEYCKRDTLGLVRLLEKMRTVES